MLRLAFAVLAHVPLADRLRDVARVGEQLRQRELALQPTGHAVHRRDQQTVTHREPSGHDRRPGRCARRLAVARCQEQTLTRDAIDVRRGRTQRDTSAVTTKVAPADVVHEDDEHVRAPSGARHEALQLRPRKLIARGKHETRLAVRGRRLDRARDRVDARIARGASFPRQTRMHVVGHRYPRRSGRRPRERRFTPTLPSSTPRSL